MSGCKICDGRLRLLGEAVIMNRHSVAYFECSACGFVQTEEPYWLADAYEHPIHRADTGHVARNLTLASVTDAVIATGFSRTKRFLDYGGGTGLFVRLMRDRGFDFYLHDPYAQNLFAQGFERPPSDAAGFELVTAFEVAEHLPDPVEGFREMLSRSGSVLFSTELLPDPAPTPSDWWYYSLETGQHVAFYTRDALQALADRFSLSLVTNGSRHLMTNNRRALRLFRFTSRPRVAKIVSNRRNHAPV